MYEKIELRSFFDSNFMQYAAYVVKDRAIPEVDDGLKPSQRRVLFSLFEMNDGRYHKCATVIGKTMSTHAHGDTSIGGALYGLANKDFLIDKQGNFGSDVTGDPAAAPRYTECRITKLAERFLWDPEVTTFVDTYDGRGKEPLKFPAKVPLLLAMGTEGIAVGMSTKVLPHNMIELLEAEKLALKNKKFEVYPDFQTGGLVDVTEYDEGRGRVKVRAKLDVSDEKRVVITELPFGSTTDSMMASIEKAAKDKKLNVNGVTDFSTDKCEIEIRLARGTYSKDVVDALYAYTECEKTVPVNLLVIQDETPVVTTTTAVVKRCAKKLVEILNAELDVKAKSLAAKILWKTIEDVFITSGAFKVVEGKKTSEDVYKAVTAAMKKAGKKVSADDVEKLIAIPIKRTSSYDSSKTSEELKRLETELKDIETKLADVKKYAASWIDETIALIKKDKPYDGHRRTEIAKFHSVDTRAIATKTYEVKYDEERGYAGTACGGDKVLTLTKFDKVIVIQQDATYTVYPVSDFSKVFVGRGAKIEVAEKEKLAGRTFVAVAKKGDYAYVSRFEVKGWIAKKVYRPVDGEVLLFGEGDFDFELDLTNRNKTVTEKFSTKKVGRGKASAKVVVAARRK